MHVHCRRSLQPIVRKHDDFLHLLSASPKLSFDRGHSVCYDVGKRTLGRFLCQIESWIETDTLDQRTILSALAHQITRLSPELRLMIAQEIEPCSMVSLAACLLLGRAFTGRLVSRRSSTFYLDCAERAVLSSLELFGHSYITTLTVSQQPLAHLSHGMAIIIGYEKFGCTHIGKLEESLKSALWYRRLNLPRQVRAVFQVCCLLFSLIIDLGANGYRD